MSWFATTIAQEISVLVTVIFLIDFLNILIFSQDRGGSSGFIRN